MMEKFEHKTSVGGFIQISHSVMQRIAAKGGGSNEITAYIVLCSGVNPQLGDRYCTHGAKSVKQRTGMTYSRATTALNWLCEHGFIKRQADDAPQFVGNLSSRSRLIRWVLNDIDSLDVAISRQFVEGAKRQSSTSALQHIFSEVSGDGITITRGQAITDVLLLYAALMKAQDFGSYAGVDPNTWHQEFEPDNSDPVGHICDIPETDFVMVTVKEVDESVTTRQFIRHLLGVDVDDEAGRQRTIDRFWLAMKHLRNLRLVYRALILWHGNPLDPKQKIKAEPIATQYINDGWAREIDPQVQYDTNRVVWEFGVRDAYEDFAGFSRGEPCLFEDSGSYRFIVRSGAERYSMLIGQLRVRYWPPDRSTVIGREIERKRTEAYRQTINTIPEYA